jgi:hypothetical protein
MAASNPFARATAASATQKLDERMREELKALGYVGP